MAEKTTNFFINSAFSPSYDLTWSFQYSLCGDIGSSGGFSTFLFNNKTLNSNAGKYVGLGFTPYGSSRGIDGAILGIMFDSTNIINIKTGNNFESLTSFNLFDQLVPFVNRNSHVFNTIRFNLTNLAKTLNISIKNKTDDRYIDVLSIDTKLSINNNTFYKIGFGLSSPLITGDPSLEIRLSDIHTQGSLNAPQTKVSDRPLPPPSLNTYYIIQTPFKEKVLIGKPDPTSDGGLLWSNGLNFSVIHEIVGDVLTLAGSNSGYSDESFGFKSQFNNPSDVAVDSFGDIYVCDTGNHAIRKISSTNGVSTFAGGISGNSDGIGKLAKFNSPNGITIDKFNNIYVADTLNHRICKINSYGEVITIAGGIQGFADGYKTSAKFNNPTDLSVDQNLNIYVSDSKNFKIRKITSDYDVTTFSGSIEGNVDGDKNNAKFGLITSLTVTPSGTIYVTDKTNYSVRKIDTNGDVLTIAGGVQGFFDYIGTIARFDYPSGVVVDINGNIYVSDFYNNKIRKILPSGDVITVCGSDQGFNDGNKSISRFYAPAGICMDSLGSLYVADSLNHKIRKIT